MSFAAMFAFRSASESFPRVRSGEAFPPMGAGMVMQDTVDLLLAGSSIKFAITRILVLLDALWCWHAD
jgi:hypothetical protein